MRIFDMMTNRLPEPIGFQFDPLRLSWKVDETTAKKQASARIVISLSPDFENAVFDSGERVDIDSLSFVPDLTLAPRTRYYWKVSVLADNGDTAEGTSFFETGKMDENWIARWITSDIRENMNLSKDIVIEKPVKRVRVYASAMGLYEMYINEDKAGDEYLAPYYNAYDAWNQVSTYDVTGMLKVGSNSLRFMMGGGWAVARFGLGGEDKLYADHESLIAEMHIEYEDGTSVVIGTDDSWHATASRIVKSSIYDGEFYDANVDISEVFPVHFDDTLTLEKLCDRLSPMLRITERIKPISLVITSKGERVIDLGQEITGWLEFRCRLPKGAKVKLSYSEILQEGCFYRDNLRSAKAEYVYISDGIDRLVRPFHSFFGFRLVKVEGINEINLDDFTGCVVHSDIERTGYIETSNPKVNRLALNALWGQRGNFLDVPTDCPQRDERMGWTGDAQAFSGTACFNMESAAFFQKYLADMYYEQCKRNGSVPHVVPECGMKGDGGSCAWADAATVIPWNLYMFYGDKELLKKTYANMRDWVEWIRRTEESNNCGRLWNVGFHFADWLALDAPSDGSRMGGTDPYYIASAYYYYSTSLLLKAAKALGYKDDVARYSKLLDEIYEALQNEYFTPNGLLAQTTQTAYVCALFMGFAPEKHRARLAGMLEQKLAENLGKLSTGFVGTAYLNRVLTANGLNERAYKLLLNEEYPGWLYEVNMGATTVWERWNSVLPDGSISDTGMNSLNHYAYGAIMEWVYRDVAGINPTENAPGFEKALIAPKPDFRLPKIDVRYNSAMGWYRSGWEIKKNLFVWDVEVPFGAEAELVFPNGDMTSIAKALPGIDVAPCEGDVKATVPAGCYHFEYVPTKIMHRVYSADMTVEEAMQLPETRDILIEEAPTMFRSAMDDDLHGSGSLTVRDMVTQGDFIRDYAPDLLEKIEKRLLALN